MWIHPRVSRMFKYMQINQCETPHQQQNKRQKLHDNLNRYSKKIHQIQNPFMIKALTKVYIEGICLNIIKAIYDKSIANIIFNGGKLRAFLLESETKQIGPTLTTSLNHSIGNPIHNNQTRNTNKRYSI